MSITEKTRWQSVKAALLDGLDPQWTEILDVLLEKSRMEMVNGQATHGDDHAAATRHLSAFTKVVLPVLRRTVPNTLTNQLIAVNMPTIDDAPAVNRNMLSVRYNPEDIEEMKVNITFDIEAEILAAIAQEVSIEFDQTVLRVLRSLPSPADIIELKESDNIIQLIIKSAIDISDRVDGDLNNCWAVISPDALTHIMVDDSGLFNRRYEGESTPEVHANYVGTIRGSIKLYVDAYACLDSPVLIGHRGDDDDDDYSGIRYHPYTLSTYGDTYAPMTDGMPLYETGHVELPDNASDYVGLISVDCFRNDVFSSY